MNKREVAGRRVLGTFKFEMLQVNYIPSEQRGETAHLFGAVPLRPTVCFKGYMYWSAAALATHLTCIVFYRQPVNFSLMLIYVERKKIHRFDNDG